MRYDYWIVPIHLVLKEKKEIVIIVIIMFNIILIWCKQHCRRGKFPTYHKLTRHTIKSTRYSQLQSTTYYCQVLLSLLRNQQKFAKCHTRTNHTSACVSDDTSISARVSDDTSSPVRVSDDTGGLARISDDIGGPIKL